KYIAQVLQDSPPDGDTAESEEQGSQDEDFINPNGINDTDFQSSRKSLISYLPFPLSEALQVQDGVKGMTLLLHGVKERN
ncbi:hypothetical protein E2320_018845, partial [Naja naja]